MAGLNLAEQKGLTLDSGIVSLAAGNGYINILKYLKLKGILPTQDSIDRGDYMSVVHWITQETGLLPSTYSANLASFNLSILQRINTQYGWLPDTNMVNYLAKKDI